MPAVPVRSRRWLVRATAFVGWTVIVGCRAQVHVAVNGHADGTNAAADLKSNPKLDYVDASVKKAPVYVDGPVAIPGEPVQVATVLGPKGEPVPVTSVFPAAFVAFKEMDASPPTKAFVRRHRDDPKAAASEPAIEIPMKTGTSKAAGKTGAWAGFDVPPLPGGIYDVWYEGSALKSGSSASNVTPRPTPNARQWTTIEIRAALRAASAVVRGRVGDTVDLSVGVQGVKRPIKVTLEGFKKDVAELASGQSATANTGADGLAHFKVHITERGDTYVYARAPGYESVAVRVVGGPLFDRLDHRLQPGDVLECQGEELGSTLIRYGEHYELLTPNPLGRPWYSHVAIYLGNREVAEMLGPGLVIHSLDAAAAGCTQVDAYRRNGVLRQQQAKIVDAIRGYGEGAKTPYAWTQIAVLASAGALSLHAKLTKGLVGLVLCAIPFVDVICIGKEVVQTLLKIALIDAIATYAIADRGRRSMICSELATWAYHDAGVAFDASPWWRDIESTGVLLDPDARVDFTTPNMISHSRDMDFVFQVWPPEAPAFIAGGQILLGEQVTFDFASAVVRPEAAELLKEVVDLLERHPEIRHVRVEGHTDDIGSDGDNQLLSEKRAEAVRKWFEQRGVAADRLSSKGFGKARPLVPNNEEHNRRRNRRVEFHIGK